jgi:3-hydroxyacyl-CoA dehydrogenase
VIEAVFEDMAVKAVFEKLDALMKPGAISRRTRPH